MTVPSVPAIVWRDFLVSALSKVGLSVWVFVLVFEVIGRLGGEQAAMIHAYGRLNLLLIAAAFSSIALPLAWWRILVIQETFRLGRKTGGRVISTESQPTLYAVWVEYEVGGRTCKRRNAVRHGGKRQLQVGDTVSVAISTRNPEVAFVHELYVDPPAED
jgi:hypothetical protein